MSIDQGHVLTVFMNHFRELENTKIHTQECLQCRQGVPCKKGQNILRAFQLRHEEVKNLMEVFGSDNGSQILEQGPKN